MKTSRIWAAAILLLSIGAIGKVGAVTSEGNEVAKAYLIGEISVSNPDAYAQYISQAPAILAECGGRYIVRAGNSVVREGPPLKGRLVMVEFPSFAAAQNCLDGTEYKAIEHLRTDNAASRIIVVEGFNP
jgi:uncharacterized protein (DUF1330 family)